MDLVPHIPHPRLKRLQLLFLCIFFGVSKIRKDVFFCLGGMKEGHAPPPIRGSSDFFFWRSPPLPRPFLSSSPILRCLSGAICFYFQMFVVDEAAAMLAQGLVPGRNVLIDLCFWSVNQFWADNSSNVGPKHRFGLCSSFRPTVM